MPAHYEWQSPIYGDAAGARAPARATITARPGAVLRDGRGEGQPVPYPTPILRYLRMVISLIEQRPVSGEEILEMLAQNLRQRSLGRRGKRAHIIERLKEHPP